MRIDDFVPQLRFALSRLPVTPETAQLRKVLGLPFTTSSEFIGECGLAVRAIQRSELLIPDDVKESLSTAMREIQKVWPDL